MPHLKFQFQLNRGRVGSPMDKLGEFATQTERFLRALIADLGLPPRKGEWVVFNFVNHSVQFDAEYAGALTDTMLAKSTRAMRAVTSDEPLSACAAGLIGYSTIAQFSKIADTLDPDETFSIGIFPFEEAGAPEIKEVSRRKLLEIRQLLSAPLISYGSIQGIMDAWHIGSKPPFFVVRQLSNSARVHCDYEDRLRQKIIAAVSRANTILHVYGDIHWERATNSIIKISVKDIEITKPLSDEEFDQVFGSIPAMTGEMTTSDYIDWLRGDAEQP